jgi:hypothetical protein
LLGDYESVVFPVNPVISRIEMEDVIRGMSRDTNDTALVYAYAAVTINLSRTSSEDAHGPVAAEIEELMVKSFAARSRADAAGYGPKEAMSVSVRKIVTCIFLEICVMAFKRYDRAFLLLREAVALIQMLDVHDNKEPGNGTAMAELARRQRLYWEAFIHERFLTIMTSYPSMLPPLRSGLPIADSTIPANVNVGFTRIIKLFLIMDDEFLQHWMAQGEDNEDARPTMTISWIEHKQQQLDDDEHDAAKDENSGLTELQLADLFITRLWLRTLVWQLAMSRCLLSSAPPSSSHEGMSIAFPARRLSTQLRSLVDSVKSQTSITMHGSGILQKLFEVTNTIADVITVVSNPSLDAEGNQRIRDLVFLVERLLSFERVDRVQRNILRTKMEALVEKFPGFGMPNFIYSPENTT